MADARKARRDAEKAARDALSGTLVGTAGDLGVAHADREDADTAITAAKQKSASIVQAADREAAEVVKAAENAAREVEAAYGSAWTKAKDAGWSPVQLKAMGYDKPLPSRRPKAGGPVPVTAPAEAGPREAGAA